MRSSTILVALAAVALAPLARPTVCAADTPARPVPKATIVPPRVPLEPSANYVIPPACAWYASVPADATTEAPRFAAYLSLSSCVSEAALSAIGAEPGAISRARLEQATRPGLAYLDGIERDGGPRWQILAESARGSLYASMMVRMRDTIRDVGDDGLPVHGARAEHAALELEMQPWRAHAVDAFARAVRLAHDHPELANNDAVIVGAVEHAQRELEALQLPTEQP